jgi:hypothetical protein
MDTPTRFTSGGGEGYIHLHVLLLEAERDTPCTSTLLAVERDTPCTSALLAVERDTPCTLTAGGGEGYTLYVYVDSAEGGD